MMAAKPLMSLVVRAAAMEKAAIVAISSASTIQSSSRPAAWTWKPKAVPMATTTTSKPNMSSIEARMGPARMANRLAGVTRNRSVTPDRSSKIVLKPGPLPLAKASRARMPGRKRSSTFPAGSPGAPTRCLSSGVNRAR